MSESMQLGEVEFFTAGAVGPAGQRVFYFQAKSPLATGVGGVVTWKAEKQQVLGLAEFLDSQLADLPAPEETFDAPDLHEPALAEWAVGSISVGYDKEGDLLLLEFEEVFNDPEGDPDFADLARASFRLTRAQTRGFVTRANQAIEGGREICRLCSRPMHPDGHTCPRQNGHSLD